MVDLFTPIPVLSFDRGLDFDKSGGLDIVEMNYSSGSQQNAIWSRQVTELGATAPVEDRISLRELAVTFNGLSPEAQARGWDSPMKNAWHQTQLTQKRFYVLGHPEDAASTYVNILAAGDKPPSQKALAQRYDHWIKPLDSNDRTAVNTELSKSTLLTDAQKTKLMSHVMAADLAKVDTDSLPTIHRFINKALQNGFASADAKSMLQELQKTQQVEWQEASQGTIPQEIAVSSGRMVERDGHTYWLPAGSERAQTQKKPDTTELDSCIRQCNTENPVGYEERSWLDSETDVRHKIHACMKDECFSRYGPPPDQSWFYRTD